MIRLFAAGVMRLRKNKSFWLFAIFSICFALFMIYTQYSDMKNYGETIEVEQLLFNYGTSAGILIAVFTSLFLGADYSDGTIRNKIIVGHKRMHIYLSNFCITAITSLFSYILFIAVVLCIGIPLFGGISMSISKLLILLGCICIAVIAYSSIFTFLAMIISNKAITAIVSIMLAFGMLMAALTCFNILKASETVQQVSMVNGEMKMETVPNPRYPSGEKRKLCQTLLDINPAGQMSQIAEGAEKNLKGLPLYSLGIIAVFTATGIALFNKKDLK